MLVPNEAFSTAAIVLRLMGGVILDLRLSLDLKLLVGVAGFSRHIFHQDINNMVSSVDGRKRRN
jgi:hypothetical protein